MVTKEDPEETKDLGMVLMEDVKPYYTAERKAKLIEEFQVGLVALEKSKIKQDRALTHPSPYPNFFLETHH